MARVARRLILLAAVSSLVVAACGQASVPTGQPPGATAATSVGAATASGASAVPVPSSAPNSAASAAPGSTGSSVATASSTSPPPPSQATPSGPAPAPSARNVPPLPALLGAIGDSISVGFNADPTVFGAQPSHSWVFGTDPSDGIDSQLERLRALGARPIVVPAAHAGDRMSDFVPQARLVIERAAVLPRGAAAYVTIELGANDLCRDTPSEMTSPATFASEFDAGLAVLRDGATIGGIQVPGLPPGSRILVLSVPDVLGLRRIIRSDPIALAIHQRFGQCRAAVDSDRTAAELRTVASRVAAFDAALHDGCAAIQAAEAPSGRLFCRDDQGGPRTDSFTGAPFTLADLSHLDYFHPSLEGQARIAAGSWAVSYWAAASP